ncbi:MAG: hypothetical protein ACRDSX_06030 [Mycobacterium sp.]
MKVQNAVYPTAPRVEALMADASDAPVVMLNLLRFRAQAAYPDGRPTSLTGRQAYDLYAAAMQKVIEERGGRLLFAGDVASFVIGDTCVLVEYRS